MQQITSNKTSATIQDESKTNDIVYLVVAFIVLMLFAAILGIIVRLQGPKQISNNVILSATTALLPSNNMPTSMQVTATPATPAIPTDWQVSHGARCFLTADNAIN